MGIVVEHNSLQRTLAMLDAAQEGVGMATVEALRSVGEYVVDQIRQGNMSSWNDQTGKLRSSIGYAVGKKGQVVAISDFGTVLQGSEGAAKGKELAERLVSEYTDDYVLVLVAGEEYAVYVEAVDNCIVLSSGWLYIKNELLNELRERVKHALDKIMKN